MSNQPIGVYQALSTKRAAAVENISTTAKHAAFPTVYAKPVPIPSKAEEIEALTRKCAKLEAENRRLRARVEVLELPTILNGVPSGKDLVRIASAVTGLRVEIIEGASRSRPHVYPRHFAIWLVRQCRWDMTVQQIARLFGNRDHTSILHALRNVDKLKDEPPFRIWMADSRVQEIIKGRQA